MIKTLNTPLLVFSLSVLLTKLAVCNDNWSYYSPNDPSTWYKTFPQCAEKRQSPINIITKNAVFDGSFNELDIRSATRIDLNLTNNGHGIRAKVFPSNVMNFTGADLKSRFVLDQFHLHVGSDGSKGSEHQIDGHKFPMEVHFIFYDVKKPPSIIAAVMSVLIVEGDANPALNKIVNNLQNCSYKGQSVQVGEVAVRNLLPKDTTAFYRYSGSFTTPPCNETVEWIVFHQTVSVSKDQLEKLRHVYASSQQETKPAPLVNNYRPVQALNGRIVRKNFDHLKFLCGKKSNTTADCRQTFEGHDVFYEVEVNPCTLPVSVHLKISVPDLGITIYKTIIEDLKTPLAIPNLKLGVMVEMHFHSDGSKAGQLHVTLYQVPLLQVVNKTKVIDNYFQVEGVCQRGNCSVDGWNNHWCTSKLGYSSKPLLFGFSSRLQNPCETPSVKLEVYRSEISGQAAWMLTSNREFKNKQSYLVNLTESIVGRSQSQKSRRDTDNTPRLSAVTLEAHIEKTSGGKTIFEIFVVTPKNGGHYLVFSTQYIYPSGQCSKSKSDGHGKKIAVGISIVVVMIIIIGIAAFLLYRNRRSYFGHRPALIDEIEVQDADRL